MINIDNVNKLLGEELKKDLDKNSKLKIIASSFSIYAFEALKKELGKIDSLEFIFDSPTFTSDDTSSLKTKEKREFHIPKNNREQDVYGNEFEILLRNKLNQKAIAKECADWIKNKVTFKSSKVNAPSQQFIYIDKQSDDNVLYTPVRSFTVADLGYKKDNSVFTSILKIRGFEQTKNYLDQFNILWEDRDKLENVTATITEHILSIYKENSPEYLYFFILYNIFNEFLEDINEDVLPDDNTGYKNSVIWNKLFDFQKDGVVGIISKMEKYNGCILADSVGLGKTFSALAVMKYYQQRNKSILVLCPKKLSENWTHYTGNTTTNILYKDRFNYDVLHHSDLTRYGGESNGMQLDRVNWGNYDVVVIDESHNFRNDEAVKGRETRYQKLMNQIIKSGVKTKVLMLSATPVNNRFNDLKNQLQLAYEGDSSNLTKELSTNKSIEEIFKKAQTTFNAWEKLSPELRTAEAILHKLDFDFFEVLDAVTIARSRKHIEKYYDVSEIGKFPERLKPISKCPALTLDKDIINYDKIFRDLSLLNLSTYTPTSYILSSKIRKYEELYDTKVGSGDGTSKLSQKSREAGLKSLMTTLMLKRLESSVHAFRLTLQNIQKNYQANIDAIDDFIANGTQHASNKTLDVEIFIDEDNDLEKEYAIGGKIKIELADMDYKGWKRDLNADIVIIGALLKTINLITPDKDSKLQDVIELLYNKIENPINANNKKVIIFSAFSDTAEYLNENIAPLLKDKYGINTALLTGRHYKNNSGHFYDFHNLLTMFSPISKEKDKILPNDNTDIDILIATDCIAEGQNLQDCDYLVNYDIHWNPVRIIQRYGRIDRIGSINEKIQLVNYWPDISLDEYINLKERVENRMVITDVTATGDDNVLSGTQNDTTYRKEQLERMQDEVIDMEDLKTGVSITDLGLNDFRMDLLNYMKNNANFTTAAKGMHSVIPANIEQGLQPGCIYVMRNIHNTVNIDSENRLHPYYIVYIKDDGDIAVKHTEVKSILDILRKYCKKHAQAHKQSYTKFNESTDDGKEMDRYSDLLSRSITSIINVKEESDIESLFSGGETTALENNIQGLDDFELIAFIAVQG